MQNKLHEIIVRHIGIHGAINVAAYMDLCLSHPEFGYYKTRDPFGVQGDFITAPEISQLFGEMIGLWVVDVWGKLGAPQSLTLCEMGAGRGTLMADILRVISKVTELDTALSVHLVETSDVLIETQKSLLGHRAQWHASIDTLPTDQPVIFIGNEFLDALPFRQLVKTKDGWRERVIALDGEALIFAAGALVEAIDLPDADEGAMYEFSPAREAIWFDICARVREQKGAALMIDYGYIMPQVKDTFQAVKDHAFADVLENCGEQDLTSHVDFSKLSNGAEIYTQGDFLRMLGIETRAEKLASLNPDKAFNINSGLNRLIHRDEMGELFKAMVYTCF